METEIELKFFVPTDFAPKLHSKITQLKVLQHSERTLENIYFDTEDLWLRQHDIGFRIRSYDDVFIQTVKTSGRVIAGLHQRPEYNAEHHSKTPDLNLHPKDIWPEGRTLDELSKQVNVIFSTNFTREQWLVSMPDGSQIEIAFDKGLVQAKGKEHPICEVELELKSGQTETLFTLARQLSEDGGMRLGSLSKAARGYQLVFADKAPQDAKIKPFGSVKLSAKDSVEECLIQSLEHALDHWNTYEQVYIDINLEEEDGFAHSVMALMQIYQSLGFIRQLFTLYKNIIPGRASAVLRQELQWLENEFLWLKSYEYLQDLTQAKGHILRKLESQKYLLTQLNDLIEHLPSKDQVLSLFYSARYTGLLLDVSRWILSKGWQPFLDEKAKDKMTSSSVHFARKQLDRSWANLLEAFPPERNMNRFDYSQQQNELQNNLYTGIVFAAFFDRHERKAFRLPWVDLLQGIDDLHMLEILERFQPNLSEEEQVQLEKWLQRQELSILHAMDQTRSRCMALIPYWQE